jgi:Ras-related protein Rab-1A
MSTYLFKIFIIGLKNSRISELVGHELRGGFDVDTTFSNGVDFRAKTVQVDDRTYTLQCWVVDLNRSLERFYFFYHSYIIGSRGVILLTNLEDKKSFTN